MLNLFRPFRAQPSFKSISSQMKFRVYSCLFVDKKEAHKLCASTYILWTTTVVCCLLSVVCCLLSVVCCP